MTEQMNRPLPVTDDEETAGFWKAATGERLVVRSCNSCSLFLHLPKSYCHHCGSWDVGWREVGPTGSVYTWTVLMHSIHPSFPAPCTIVLVQLDEDPAIRFVGYLDGTPELASGTPVRVRFEHVEPGVTVPQWELAE
ncbi:Zn-ribbon domain-containing OB-fold protein [Nocardia fusca]|uniref:Zn-ribbon domain-containing OB-fold protein n=1 Tax=Nocardia fusca TaxID=941183 RepID=UPI0007A74C95|nr:OB-fold domain-containing protein [Nocardia fusca]